MLRQIPRGLAHLPDPTTRLRSGFNPPAVTFFFHKVTLPVLDTANGQAVLSAMQIIVTWEISHTGPVSQGCFRPHPVRVHGANAQFHPGIGILQGALAVSAQGIHLV